MGIENITAVDGFQLALAGMSIVFVALAAVTCFISLLPKALPLLSRILPEVHHATAALPRKAPATDENAAKAAAAAFALHHKRGARS